MPIAECRIEVKAKKEWTVKTHMGEIEVHAADESEVREIVELSLDIPRNSEMTIIEKN